ncbi:hypothetical protein ACPSLY_25065 (plasmid) [Vibrio parahaemolyticus]|uniref:Uncharacterized protein n=5 Tax=Vibrio harveyi group TaxID=717610 RepID=A0A077ER87_VIBPH|nr:MULTISPECIES: hypothetical protein [Gammaproteobacteria]ETZ12075.1 hypothetical protein AJ90_20635 [Vibrio parahaemolyticus M0605]AIL49947.1 hypothetical protein [Vibrio parahaemolyticus]AKC05672.1 hypothetical protein pVA1052 [Vibrio parahaemolyticus]AQZ36700.1 hypothetical protein [Vibrio parahaemolyticus v110]ARR10046.1 hypothetical protein Vc3S01_p10016 [Vibrio campbellii]
MKWLMLIFIGGCTVNFQVETTSTAQSGNGELAEVIETKETSETDAQVFPVK